MDTIFIEYFTTRCPETVRDSSFSIYTYVDPNKLLRTRTQIILHLIEVSLNFTLLFTFALFKVIQVLKAIVSKLQKSHPFKRQSLISSEQSGPRLEQFCQFKSILYFTLYKIFTYHILSAISRDPKLLTLKLNTIVFKHKHKPFSYKPRPMCFARLVCEYMRIYLSFTKSIIFVQVKLSAISQNPLYNSGFNSSQAKHVEKSLGLQLIKYSRLENKVSDT